MKYNEDVADKQINNKKLKETFNMLQEKDSNIIIKNDFLSEKNTKEEKNPDTILYENIDRAGRLLDKLEEELDNGVSARLFEVASALINSITQASSSIVGTNQHEDELLYKNRLLELKEREVIIKEALGKNDNKKIGKIENANILLTNREDLLDLINKK